MQIIKGIKNLKETSRNPVVTLGNFDGVHLGHQEIFRRVREEASKIHGEGMVITFEPHPLKVLAPDKCLSLLTPFRNKMMLIEKSGLKPCSASIFIRILRDFSIRIYQKHSAGKG